MNSSHSHPEHFHRPHRRSWVAIIAGLIAGMVCFGLWVYSVHRSVSPYGTLRLDFLTAENIAIPISGYQEPRLLPLPLSEGKGFLPFVVADQTQPEGRKADNVYYPDVSIPWDRLVEIGIYLEPVDDLTQESTRGRFQLNQARILLEDGQVLAATREAMQIQRGSLVSLTVNRDVAHTLASRSGPMILELSAPADGVVGLVGLPQTHIKPANPPFPAGRFRANFQLVPAPEGGSGFSRVLLSGQSPSSLAAVSEPMEADAIPCRFFPSGRLIVDQPGSDVPLHVLLAGVFQWPRSSHWISVSLGLASVFVGMGVYLLLRPAHPHHTALGSLLLIVGLGWPFVLFQLPVAGRDEIKHALSFLRVIGNEPSLLELDTMARRLHQHRMYGQADQHLSLSDLDNPEGFALNHGYLATESGLNFFAQDYSWRAPVVARFWKLARPFLSGHSMELRLLGLRFLTLLSSALLIAGTLWMIRPTGSSQRSHFTVLLYWAAPLTFLGLIGNYAQLYAAYLAIGLILSHWLAGHPPDRRNLFALGILSSVGMGCGINAWPVILILSLWLIPYLAIHHDSSKKYTLGALWGSYGLGLLSVTLWLSPEFITKNLNRQSALLPDSRFSAFFLFLAAIAVATAGARILSVTLAQFWIRLRCQTIVRQGVVVLAGGLGLLGIVWALALSPVHLPDFEIPWRPSPMVGGGDAPKRSVSRVLEQPTPLPRVEASKRAVLTWITNAGPWMSDLIVMRDFLTALAHYDVRVPKLFSVLAGTTLLLGWFAAGPLRFGGKAASALLWGTGILCLIFLSQVYWYRPLLGRYAAGVYLVFLLPWAVQGWQRLCTPESSDGEGLEKLSPLSLFRKEGLPALGLIGGVLVQAGVVLAILQGNFLLD